MPGTKVLKQNKNNTGNNLDNILMQKHDINEFLILFPFYEKPSTIMVKQRYNKTIRSTASNKDSLSKYTESRLKLQDETQ